MKTIITLSAAIALSLTTHMNVAFGGGWGANHGDRAQMRQARIEKILARFDANQDGQITQEEVQKVRIDHFTQMDTDGNDLVSLEEFESFKAAKQQERQAQKDGKQCNRKHGRKWDAGSHFAHLDMSGDNQLSIEEFTAQLPIFNKWDANEDGVITTEELNQRPQRRR